MTAQPDKISSKEVLVTSFRWTFLLPKYWLIWLAVFILILLSLLPSKIIDPILAKIGKKIGRKQRSARHRLTANLCYCFPHLTESQREKLTDNTFEVVLPVTLLLVRTVIRGASAIKVVWHNEQVIEQASAKNNKLIFLVPHAWCVDLPAMLMAARGQKMAAFIHTQSNEVVDWLWNKARYRFGGRLHARNDGIKPFIKSVREGYWGYYLPDEDLGIQHSVFAKFFATYKATLPLIGRIEKICNATIIPLFPVYDVKTSTLHIMIRPPMDRLAEASDLEIATKMNEEIEALVTPNPEQYAWVLRFLKTRKEGEPDPYTRKDR